jgi:ATP-dependent Clp protease ATP-binding subunit ClpB
VAEAGFDPVYGARPLKRVLQNRVENPLAKEILAGNFHPGDTIEVDVEGGDFVFHRKENGYAQAASA